MPGRDNPGAYFPSKECNKLRQFLEEVDAGGYVTRHDFELTVARAILEIQEGISDYMRNKE